MKRALGLVLTMMLFISCEVEGIGNSSSSSGSSTNSGSNGGCPTTAACGCSGHNKSECENDFCCKWTVGEGCGCS